MGTLVGAVGALIIFGAIILVHEFGHFIVAKRTGMLVYEFSMGFGPAIFSKEIGGTLYAIRIIPLGGYVRIAGMEPGEEDTPNGFDKKPFLARFGTIFAGPVMNMVLALVVFIIIGMAIGYPKPGKDSIVTGVQINSPADRVGLQINDQFVEIAGIKNPDYEQVSNAIKTSPPPIPIVVRRNGTLISMKVTPKPILTAERVGLIYKTTTYQGIGIGIGSLSTDWERLGPLESVTTGFIGVKNLIVEGLAQIVSLVTGHIPFKALSGPLGIIQTSYSVSKSALDSRLGLSSFFNTIAFLSVLVGIFNLIPIPALDGSRLVIVAIEGIIRKPFNREKEALVHLVGMALLLGLIAVISIKDLLALRGG
jgi:regulator of sigma E protease